MPFSGFDGYVAVSTEEGLKVIGRMNRWTVSTSQDTIDVSAFDPEAGPIAKRFRKFLPGPLGWTATFEGFVEPTDTGQKAIKDALWNATELSFYFHLDGTKYLAGKGVLTGEDIELTWDGAGTISYDVQGTGMLDKIGWE
jgi:hypothetical protein